MIDALGPFLLILMTRGVGPEGIAIQEMPSFAACQAAIVQLQPVRSITGYCIAKHVLEE
jgi:hypothetical protein